MTYPLHGSPQLKAFKLRISKRRQRLHDHLGIVVLDVVITWHSNGDDSDMRSVLIDRYPRSTETAPMKGGLAAPLFIQRSVQPEPLPRPPCFPSSRRISSPRLPFAYEPVAGRHPPHTVRMWSDKRCPYRGDYYESSVSCPYGYGQVTSPIPLKRHFPGQQAGQSVRRRALLPHMPISAVGAPCARAFAAKA